MQKRGRATWGYWPEWVRGPAQIAGDEIVLETTQAETYGMYEPEDLVFDLVNLSPLSKSFEGPEGAVRFVEKHGLLWHGPDELSNDSCRESLSDWWEAADNFISIMWLHYHLKEALRAGSAEPLKEVADLSDYFAPGVHPTDEDYLERVSVLIAEAMSEGLEGCSVGVAPAAALWKEGKRAGGPGVFMFSHRPPDLLTAAYAHFAMMIVHSREVGQCPGCGRMFLPKSGKQKYCSESCANTARWRRWKERQAASA